MNTATATLTGIGLYKGTTSATFSIAQKPLTITADSATKVYDGTALTTNTFTNTELATGDANLQSALLMSSHGS